MSDIIETGTVITSYSVFLAKQPAIVVSWALCSWLLLLVAALSLVVQLLSPWAVCISGGRSGRAGAAVTSDEVSMAVRNPYEAMIA